MRLAAALLILPALVIADRPDGHGLEWLPGCWVSGDRSAQEVWVAEGDSSLVGFAVAISDGKVGFYEVLSIRRADDGSWTYTAHPSGQPAASFVAAEIDGNSVIFANPGHDYPQEIRYVREDARLTATISLLGGVKPVSFEKVACDEEP